MSILGISRDDKGPPRKEVQNPFQLEEGEALMSWAMHDDSDVSPEEQEAIDKAIELETMKDPGVRGTNVVIKLLLERAEFTGDKDGLLRDAATKLGKTVELRERDYLSYLARQGDEQIEASLAEMRQEIRGMEVHLKSFITERVVLIRGDINVRSWWSMLWKGKR